jgi:hypothetical protein
MNELEALEKLTDLLTTYHQGLGNITQMVIEIKTEIFRIKSRLDTMKAANGSIIRRMDLLENKMNEKP